jgi:SAM-dependent methyltransferase
VPWRIGSRSAQSHRVGVEIYQRRGAQASGKIRLLITQCCVVCVALVAGLAASAARGQVPFVPTPPEVVERMLAMAKVSKADYIIDLGSGDGRVLRIAAQKYGARGFGVDLDEELIERSKMLARRDGVSDRVSFLAQDLFKTDISEASVLTMYLLPAVNMKLRPRLLTELKPGTRVVSHDFDLGDWEADETATLYAKEKYGASGGDSTVYLWIVPANAAGRWQWRLQFAGQSLDYELSLTQHFQRLRGVLRSAQSEAKVEAVELRGDQISITAVANVKGSPVRHVFSGRVGGDAIEGEVRLSGARIQGAQQWSAVRVAVSASSVSSVAIGATSMR